jgi:hypothetical protein
MHYVSPGPEKAWLIVAGLGLIYPPAVNDVDMFLQEALP